MKQTGRDPGEVLGDLVLLKNCFGSKEGIRKLNMKKHLRAVRGNAAFYLEICEWELRSCECLSSSSRGLNLGWKNECGREGCEFQRVGRGDLSSQQQKQEVS